MSTPEPDRPDEEKGVIRYETPRGSITLTVKIVRQFFCPKATELEALAFAGYCKHTGLNPFLREVYLIKYDEAEPASLIVAYQSFMKRAERAEGYGGFRAGIVIAPGAELARVPQLDGDKEVPGIPAPFVALEGTLIPPDWKLAGGWCLVTRAGRPNGVSTVRLEEYLQRRRDGKPTRAWERMPSTMIRKVAIGQAFRDGWPDELAGLVLEEEGGARIGEAERATALTVDEMAEDLLPRRTEPAEETAGPRTPDTEGDLDVVAERNALIGKIETLRVNKRLAAPSFAQLMHTHLGSGGYDAASLDALIAFYDAVALMLTPSSENPTHPHTASPATATTFQIGARTYQTAGIDKETLLATFQAEATVDKKQKGLAKAMLRKHFGVESRTDLTLEQGRKYLELLWTAEGAAK